MPLKNWNKNSITIIVRQGGIKWTMIPSLCKGLSYNNLLIVATELFVHPDGNIVIVTRSLILIILGAFKLAA